MRASLTVAGLVTSSSVSPCQLGGSSSTSPIFTPILELFGLDVFWLTDNVRLSMIIDLTDHLTLAVLITKDYNEHEECRHCNYPSSGVRQTGWSLRVDFS